MVNPIDLLSGLIKGLRGNLNNEIMVSVCCLSYNHELYVRQALESFIMQKTNFLFEIVVHDDASTDKTSKIICEYFEKHPDLIKPIFEKENQFSKGKPMQMVIENIFPHAKGKYIAIVESDDYWIDQNKLQKQFDYMESHPECSLACHASRNLRRDGTVDDFLQSETPTFFPVEYIIRHGSMIPSASLFFRAKDVMDYPEFNYLSFAGDRSLTVHLSLLGTVFYSPEVMSVYRNYSYQSVTSINQKNPTLAIGRNKRAINYLNALNKYTNGQYGGVIREEILKLSFSIAVMENDLKALTSSELLPLFKKLKLYSRIRIRFADRFPKIHDAIYSRYRKKKIGKLMISD